MFFNFPILILSSIVGFLLPIYASYKALKTSDPAQLTPWLMYWAVFGCGLVIESWTEWILGWLPFYYTARLFLLIYLVSPQTQGARYLYETYVHTFIEENESQIDELIVRTHQQLRAAGLEYLRQAIELFRTRVLGMPPSEPTASPTQAPTPQSYTQALMSRFSVPSPRWSTGPPAPQQQQPAGNDFYNMLAGAVSAIATGAAPQAGGSGDAPSRPGSLIPPNVRGASERANFIAAQRSRLTTLLSALENEAQREDDGDDSSPWHSPLQRPASGLSGFSGASGLSKSRSEADFEKIDVDGSGPEDDGVRRRYGGGKAPSGGWTPFGWSSSSADEKRD